MRAVTRCTSLLLLALVTAGCERSPVELPLAVRIEAPIAGAVVKGTATVIAGVVERATSPTVSISVNGGSFVPATMVAGTTHAFEAMLTGLAFGPTTVTVRVTDGDRVATATHTFVVEPLPVAIELKLPIPGPTVFGRVAPFSGTVSRSSVVVRYSLNNGPERAVQQYPPLPGDGDAAAFYAEAQALADGANTIELRAYDGQALVASRSLTVNAEVARQRYDVTLVTEPEPGSAVWRMRLANDGRIGGAFVLSSASYPFTWHAGIGTPLPQLNLFYDMNNLGQVLGSTLPIGAPPKLWENGTYRSVTEFPEAVMINDRGDLARSIWAGYWRDGQMVSYPQTGMVELADMNNHGDLAGHLFAMNGAHPAPVVWIDGQQRPIGLGPLYRYGSAFRIGDGRHVLLQGTTSSTIPELSGTRSLLFHGGAVVDLSAAIGLATVARDVNASGVVVGQYTRNGSPTPFVWSGGRQVDVVVNSSEWAVEAAWAINDSGQLAVQARRIATGALGVLLLTPAGP